MWKPGQIVTVSGKRYRIRRCLTGVFHTCRVCNAAVSFKVLLSEPCITCRSKKMPGDCYPQEIKPKSVMG